jgi:hypothetical protein
MMALLTLPQAEQIAYLLCRHAHVARIAIRHLGSFGG